MGTHGFNEYALLIVAKRVSAHPLGAGVCGLGAPEIFQSVDDLDSTRFRRHFRSFRV